MNNCFDAVIESAYTVIEKEFNKRKGIVSPIRAVVWNFGENNNIDEAVDSVDCAVDLYMDTFNARQIEEDLLYRF